MTIWFDVTNSIEIWRGGIVGIISCVRMFSPNSKEMYGYTINHFSPLTIMGFTPNCWGT